MKNRYIRYALFCIPLIIATLFTGCSDDKEINYLDDNAYPPPSVSITSSASLDEVVYANEETVTGVVESPRMDYAMYTEPFYGKWAIVMKR